jgi:hypothetical protein
MAGVKKLITGLIIGVLIGLWFGVNIGKGRPFWSNPFTEVADKAKQKTDQVIEGAKDSLRKKLDEPKN